MLNLTGQRFGRLQALWPAGRRGNRLYWACQCDDGKVSVVATSDLRYGNTKSCGCLQKEMRDATLAKSFKHGLARRNSTPEARAFMSARKRCLLVNAKDYKYYGGRGIEFRFESFEQFLADVGLKPHPELSLDRKNTNGHYEPGNVRWSTPKEQANNRRISGRQKV